MGLFDFLRRKPKPADSDGPSPHYVLAHYALRQFALLEPLKFLAIAASPDAPRFVKLVLEDVIEKCGRPANFTSADVKLHACRVKNYPCVVIEMPPPGETAEAHLTALLALIDVHAERPADLHKVSARYFTLEKGFTLGDEPRTVLAEWDMNMHSNYGDGPPATVAAFVEAIGGHV